jgi:hypothetical protein
MNRDDREVEQSPVKQGVDEKISYVFDWEILGTPTTPVVKLYDITDGGYTDVTSTNLLGSPSIVEHLVLTPKVKALKDKKHYSLECMADINGNTLESFCHIICEL